VKVLCVVGIRGFLPSECPARPRTIGGCGVPERSTVALLTAVVVAQFRSSGPTSPYRLNTKYSKSNGQHRYLIGTITAETLALNEDLIFRKQLLGQNFDYSAIAHG
jgi:hypothetical protein